MQSKQIRQFLIIGVVILVMVLILIGVQSGYIMNTPETDEAILESYKRDAR